LRQRPRFQADLRRPRRQALEKAISACGSLATFASFTSVPSASTTQTEEALSDTSIPA
jgi:hypothetical protein